MKNVFLMEKGYFNVYNGMIPVFRTAVVLIVAITTLVYNTSTVGWKLNIGCIGVLIYIVYSLLLLIFSDLRKHLAYNYPFVIPVIDILLLSFCIINTGGGESPFYLFYVFFIVFFSVVYGLKKSVIAGVISSICYSAAVLISDGYFSFEVFVRVVFFLTLSAFTGYIYEKISMHTYSMATRDSLTTLYNHQYFYSSLEYILSKNSKDGSPVSLAIFDVDNFKQINDKYGHLEGDRILVKISSIIKENIRSEDIAARYGGDEIVIVLPNTDSKAALKVCQRIKEIFQQGFETVTGEEITLSVGIATFPYNGTTSLELFHAADQALYRAKNNGKNAVEYCSA